MWWVEGDLAEIEEYIESKRTMIASQPRSPNFLIFGFKPSPSFTIEMMEYGDWEAPLEVL